MPERRLRKTREAYRVAVLPAETYPYVALRDAFEGWFPAQKDLPADAARILRENLSDLYVEEPTADTPWAV